MEEWFRDPGNMVLAMFAALFLMGIARLPRILAWFQRVQMLLTSPFQGGIAWSRVGRAPALRMQQPTVVSVSAALAPPPMLPGAGRALLNPPGVVPSLEYMRRMSPNDRYLLPLGWQTTGRPQPDLVHTVLVGETNHVLISGASDSGKDNLAWWMLLSLALAHPTRASCRSRSSMGRASTFSPGRGKPRLGRWPLTLRRSPTCSVPSALSDSAARLSSRRPA